MGRDRYPLFEARPYVDNIAELEKNKFSMFAKKNSFCFVIEIDNFKISSPVTIEYEKNQVLSVDCYEFMQNIPGGEHKKG